MASAAAATNPAPPAAAGGAKPTKPAVVICPGHVRPVRRVCFSDATPDGVFFISAALDRTPMLRHAHPDNLGNWVGTFQGHSGAIWCARLNRAATQAITASADFSLGVWNAASGQMQLKVEAGHVVRTCAYSPDQKSVVFGGHEHLVQVLEIAPVLPASPAAAKAAVRVVGKTASGLRHVAWPSPSRVVVSTVDAHALSVWDPTATSEAPLRTIPMPGKVGYCDVSAPPGGAAPLLVVCSLNKVMFYNVDTLELEHSFSAGEDDGVVASAAVNAARTVVAVSRENDLVVYTYDYATGKQIKAYKGHHGPVHCVDWMPDGSAFASGSEDGQIRLWCRPQTLAAATAAAAAKPAASAASAAAAAGKP